VARRPLLRSITRGQHGALEGSLDGHSPAKRRSGYTAASRHISVKEFRVGVPKRKVSKARQGERRAHLAISAPPLVECEHCHELKRAHHVCPTCGWYAGREAVVIEPVAPVEGQR